MLTHSVSSISIYYILILTLMCQLVWEQRMVKNKNLSKVTTCEMDVDKIIMENKYPRMSYKLIFQLNYFTNL